MMRLALATLALVTLAACSGGSSGGPDNDENFYPNCDEQAELALNGRTDGKEIRITCP